MSRASKKVVAFIAIAVSILAAWGIAEWSVVSMVGDRSGNGDLLVLPGPVESAPSVVATDVPEASTSFPIRKVSSPASSAAAEGARIDRASATEPIVEESLDRRRAAARAAAADDPGMSIAILAASPAEMERDPSRRAAPPLGADGTSIKFLSPPPDLMGNATSHEAGR